MINKSKGTTSIINGFDKLTESIAKEKGPDWLGKLRSQSLTRFTELGIPTTKDEEWKYTNLSSLTKHTYTLTTNNELKEIPAFNQYCEKSEINVVFVNGVLTDSLSNFGKLPKGVSITPLKEAYAKNGSDIEALLTKYDTQKESTFVALNNALTDSGVFIKIDPNTVCEKLIHIVHVTSASNGEALSLPKTVITAGQSSEATILESHVAFTDTITYFSNALTDIYVDDNTTLHYCKAQKESQKAFHIGHTRVWQERNSNFDGFILTVGGCITRNNLDIVLNGEGANTRLNGLYSIYGKQHVDNHTVVDHRFPNCTSNQLYKGILNESSRAVFNGKIYVRSAAQKTNSYQLNKNLLLGKDCRVDTKPQLEIFADDVKCTHGATIGQLNEDELFYLQTRCIPRTDAVKILARGFVDDLLNTIKNEHINQKLHILLEPSFAEL